MAAVADHIYGPYGDRHLEIPHAGHNMLFKTKEGQWMSAFFGSDPKAIFSERPAILPVEISPAGRILPLMQTATPPEQPADRE